MNANYVPQVHFIVVESVDIDKMSSFLSKKND